jgi:2-oxo-4-hydroxy-4-carboxy--5-ureidoimidazoline (OHCU) decarboxylase
VAVDSVDILTSPITVWAEKYPIEDISFLRRSVSDTLFSQLNSKGLGLQETVGSIAVSAYDIRERLTIYTDQIPKQARWQAEYLIDRKLNDEQLKRSFDNFERISNSIDRMTKIIEQSPDLAGRLQYRTMAQLTAERIAIMEALSKERMAVLDDVQRQRLATIKDVENLAQNILSASEMRAESLINHFYLRLLQILVLIYIISLITFIVLKKTFWPGKRST